MNTKTIIALSCFALLAITNPAKGANMVMEMGVAEQIDDQAPAISVDGNIINVQNASGMNLEIVSLTGKAVASYKIEGAAQRIELNLPKGCYILKVGKVVRKVTVR
ncbi:MAG: T9SS type A sorting domain-containing protein [Prevotella sp.]|nr:T9SS type A sorting domain-containing protein [Prevotella sp.]